MARGAQTIEAAGFRVGARLSVGAAIERVEQQAHATAVWLELDTDCGDAMDELLNRLNRDVTDGRYGAVVSTTASLLEQIFARIENNTIEVIVNAGDGERAAALAVAAARKNEALRVCDIAKDNSAERLRQLSEEVNRIASTLARLSAAPGTTPPPPEGSQVVDLPPLAADTVRSIIRARRLRERFFAEDLFADPAWDMLLDLLQAEIEQHRVPVSSLCIAAAVPATTALRWLKTMVNSGILVRRSDPHDGRRVFVELAPETSRALRSYFAEVGKASVI
jgi:DNA-binding MarR family transcriptional regulator